ncbi:hypothetical protein WICPIJ_000075 [Wickerhamomyces pijperi]|uniref:Uncharacterized protein n=1 Tax=Wickerhamomyces pijperi TaxID=599730 RepID=A0A9P8QHM6_WICPI|nr:hypothetical protein WICPIJ_000075 [Wickerhamomyces pijperi]
MVVVVADGTVVSKAVLAGCIDLLLSLEFGLGQEEPVFELRRISAAAAVVVVVLELFLEVARQLEEHYDPEILTSITATGFLDQSSFVILECCKSFFQLSGNPVKFPLVGSNPTCTLWVKFVGDETVPVSGHLAKMASNQPSKSDWVFTETNKLFLLPVALTVRAPIELVLAFLISSKQYGLCCTFVSVTIVDTGIFSHISSLSSAL